MRANLTRRVYFVLFIYYELVHAQEVATGDQPVVNALAIGGMLQGLLDMQIRPQGGFYEERYKDIFPDSANIPLATNNAFDRRHKLSNFLTNRDIISEDGKALSKASTGGSPNPCHDENRIFRNRLLLLMCTLRSVKEQTADQELA